MKRAMVFVLLAALLLCSAGAESTWHPRTISAPENELQQAVYDFALAQAKIMKRNLKCTSENMKAEQEYGILSDVLFSFLQVPDETFAEPLTVVVMTPTPSFGEGGAAQVDFVNNPEDFTEELWSSVGMRVAHYANSFNGNMYQVEYLDSLAIHSAQDFPVGRGMAYAMVFYGEGMPQIGVSILLSEDGSACCQTDVIYFDQIAEYFPTFMVTAINYWGDTSFETVYIK